MSKAAFSVSIDDGAQLAAHHVVEGPELLEFAGHLLGGADDVVCGATGLFGFALGQAEHHVPVKGQGDQPLRKECGDDDDEGADGVADRANQCPIDGWKVWWNQSLKK